MKRRPDIIKNWREIESTAEWRWPEAAETFGYPAFFSFYAGGSRLKVAQLRLPPGRRANLPTACRDEEEFVFVLEGRPDLWADGHLYGLEEGDGVALLSGTGIATTFINNGNSDVRLFVLGEGTRTSTRYFHPLDANANERLKQAGQLWHEAPKRKLGPNDGRPGSKAGRTRQRPDYVAHWRDILDRDKRFTYPGSKEYHGIEARFGQRAGFSRIGIHLEVLKPGRRTSWPHAERDEDEFVYVVSGSVDCWLDGTITPMWAGDFVGWEAGTGTTHVVINNSDEDAVLLVGGEASRVRAQVWYPLHPRRNKEIGERCWKDHPAVKLGPHDGVPDRLRESFPAAARRTAVAANDAARKYGLRAKSKAR